VLEPAIAQAAAAERLTLVLGTLSGGKNSIGSGTWTEDMIVPKGEILEAATSTACRGWPNAEPSV